MSDGIGSVTRDEYLAGRSPALLRLAHQLTGDPALAVEVVAAAAARLPGGRHEDGELDREMTARLVREAARRGVWRVAEGPLLALAPAQRASVVLAFGPGWDAETIAEVRRTTPRRVRRDVAFALVSMPEDGWRRLLADPRWALPVPDDLFRRSRLVRSTRRRRRLLAALAAACAATAVAGGVIAVVRVATAPGSLPATATARGLLHWPPRGDLVRDRALTDRATRLWQASATPPQGHVYVLYAGRVGVGRLVVMQAKTAPGSAAVAVVGDHDVTYRHPRLRLDAVAPLLRTDVPVLAVPYDGNLNIPGLTAGPGSQVDQLLVAPGVERVDERSIRGRITGERPKFVAQPLSHGLSDPWLNLIRQRQVTAVRAFRSDGRRFVGLLTGRAVQPLPLDGVATAPPPRWRGLPHTFPLSGLADDVLWWAQVCGTPAPYTSLIWAGGAPGFPTAVRLELVRCEQVTTAHFLTGISDNAVELAADRGAGAGPVAFAGLVEPTSPAPLSVIVVGSRQVRSIHTGSRRIQGRVAVFRATDAGRLWVVRRNGHVVPIR